MHPSDNAFSGVCCLPLSLLRWQSRVPQLRKRSLLNLHILPCQLLPGQYGDVYLQEYPSSRKPVRNGLNSRKTLATLFLGQLGAVASYLPVPTILPLAFHSNLRGASPQRIQHSKMRAGRLLQQNQRHVCAGKTGKRLGEGAVGPGASTRLVRWERST